MVIKRIILGEIIVTRFLPFGIENRFFSVTEKSVLAQHQAFTSGRSVLLRAQIDCWRIPYGWMVLGMRFARCGARRRPFEAWSESFRPGRYEAREQSSCRNG